MTRGPATACVIVAGLCALQFEAFWLLRGPIGIDVSHHQKKIDWRKLAGSGVAFAYIKATEGGDYIDDRFAENWREAGAAGLPRGAYHYFRLCRSGALQARNFIATIPREAYALPPVVDVEDMEVCEPSVGTLGLEAELRAFLDLVEAHFGCRPIVYTTFEFDRGYLGGKLASETFWVRSLFLAPQFRRQSWLFWQYHNAGRRDGIDRPVDLNVFRGEPKDFAEFATGCRAG